ncbi:unnamed protein product [Caretta caretta]
METEPYYYYQEEEMETDPPSGCTGDRVGTRNVLSIPTKALRGKFIFLQSRQRKAGFTMSLVISVKEVLWELELWLVLSAYADDVLLVVQNPGDLARVEACQATYLAAYSTWEVLREPELWLVLSAYADDVLLVVQDPGDMAWVEACQATYLAASCTWVN